MGIGEQGPAFRQRVDMGCLNLRVALEAAHPVIQIINDDKDDIGLMVLFVRRDITGAGCHRHQADEDTGNLKERSQHEVFLLW